MDKHTNTKKKKNSKINNPKTTIGKAKNIENKKIVNLYKEEKRNLSNQKNKKKSHTTIKSNDKELNLKQKKEINNEKEEEKGEKEEFYCLDKINIFQNPVNSNNIKGEKEFILITHSKNNDNDLIKSSYKVKDFIEKYKFIYIHFGVKVFKFLVLKNNNYTTKKEEDEILNKIKQSFWIKKFEKHFNINFNSYKEYFSLERRNNSDNNFNLKVVEIKNNDQDTNKNKIINTNIFNNNNNITINTTTTIANNNLNNNYNIINNNLEFFPLVGLNNVGSTCFMNATLQCLIHIPELSLYFLNEYPNDKKVLNYKNSSVKSKGQLSEAYYEVVKGVKNSYSSYSPKTFKQILGRYNSQFSSYEANDSKDLILYLLQTFHEELNYFGDKTPPKNIPYPNPTQQGYIYNYFNTIYNYTNFSKISLLFYGTYESNILCLDCKTNYYSYQKFEYISFSTYKYRNRTFDIINGFEDIESKQKLFGDNKYYCNKCRKLANAEIYCKISDLPKYLILNIDYGKNKVNDVYQLNFSHEIDLKKYLSLYFGQKTKYKLVAICTHIGSSGPCGHYIAYCLNKKTGNWYRFNDSSCRMVDKYQLNSDSPYLLIYEMI